MKLKNIIDDSGGGFFSRLKLNGVSIKAENDPARNVFVYSTKSNTLNEVAVVSRIKRGNKGGIITFSIDANVNKSLLKNKLTTLFNKLTKNKRIDKTLNNHEEIYGYSIGNLFHGIYKSKSTKKTYSEKSTSIEIVGITKKLLIEIAEEICRNLIKKQSWLNLMMIMISFL